jgi:penicillin-binding protein 1A
MGEAEAYLTTSLLMSVVDHGTGAAAKNVGRPVAGKTGTSNQAKDTWFVGYSTDIVCATWTGYDDARPLGGREQGAITALPAWISFMKAAHEKRPATEFPRPPGIVTTKIDPKTGLRAYDGEDDSIDEVFLQGTEPQEVSSPYAGIAADGGIEILSGPLPADDAGAPPPEVSPTTVGDAGLPQLPAEDPPPF